MTTEEYVNEVSAGKIIKFEVQTLRNWRCKGIGPPYYKINKRCIRYKIKDLHEFMSKHKINP